MIIICLTIGELLFHGCFEKYACICDAVVKMMIVIGSMCNT
jgi:hypothetical protein